ncbi:hypothetical protein H7J88_10580 [Mycolicibacterium flavescens]|uniref:Uncharacterized protein n=1 Tax=Mycolicibacterium flavescens TaxID=1776 RepID=A0A1E3RCS2_MYCFV|nr:hypothetical protein [Mycolicibacterium flavescens]MCV7280093.1 hypothetical protein [Mycolicibacterium flavescens]ODQ87639.1 hypothetical protein BHQ18_22785 [Mycolicibacterium flavescens]
MKIRGPLVTLFAAAAVGTGMWFVNVVNDESAPVRIAERPAPARVAERSAPTTTTVKPPPAPAFPAKADYIGKIPTAAGTITLNVSVDGQQAVAYACDGKAVESWMRGSAANGAVRLASRDKTGRLDGRLVGDTVVGTLWIGKKSWDFAAPVAQLPAGTYVYEEAGVRSSWIVDSAGAVTGVLKAVDGSTKPAPELSTDGTSVIGGRTVSAVRIGAGTDA